MILYVILLLNLVFLATIGILVYLWVKKTLGSNQDRLMDSFKANSYEMTQKNNESFLTLAKTYFDKHFDSHKENIQNNQKHFENFVNPLKESLNKLDDYNKKIESRREGAYSSLKEQINALMSNEKMLRDETNKLASALKSPNIRGAWGQLHLKRVVEISGLSNNCDFFEQESITSDDKTFRPDMIVKLPNDRHIIIDAKTPINSYIEYVNAQNENVKEIKLKDHANNIKKHIDLLSSKEYWKKFPSAIEFVILFLPAEAFFSAALQVEPTILENSARKNIIIATPTTLIAILRSVAHGWKQDNLSKNFKEIAVVGKELFERIHIVNNHLAKLGRNLALSVDSYNSAVSSFESRMMVTLKKLKDIGASNENKEDLKISQITKTTKTLLVDNKD